HNGFHLGAREGTHVVVRLGRCHLDKRQGFDEFRIVVDRNPRDLKVLEGPGGLDTIVGVRRDLLLPQQVLFDPERLLGGKGWDHEQADGAGQKRGNISSHKHLRFTSGPIGPWSWPRPWQSRWLPARAA